MSTQALARYVPLELARWLFARGSSTPERPVYADVNAAVLFADISGFTTLADALAVRGAAGAEDLSNILNDYFGRLTGIVADHGGEIVGFPGDAAIVLWRDPQEDGASPTVLAHRSAACALSLQTALDGYEALGTSPLRLRIGAAAGTVRLIALGIPATRQFLLATGAPIAAACDSQGLAAPGEVVVTRAFADLLPHAETRQTGRDHRHLVSIAPDVGARIGAAIDAGTIPHLESLIPRFVRSRIGEGLGSWLGELRQVSVLFMNFQHIDFEDAAAVCRVQPAMCELINAVVDYGGSATELVFDDKGTTFVAAWGLPGATSEVDAARAARCGEVLLTSAERHGLSASAGIATGRVFCGDRGGDTRRSYAMIGRIVNRAARFMKLAGEAVVCDQETHQAAQEKDPQLDFQPLPAYHLKGSERPIPLYRLRTRRSEPDASHTASMLGREREFRALQERLEQLVDGTREAATSICLVEGEPGIGKSTLLTQFLQNARRLKLRAVAGAATAIETSSSYRPFRSILNEVLELTGLAPETREDRVLTLLEALGKRDLAPLLNEVLGLTFRETGFTVQLDGQLRASNTRDLLIDLFMHNGAPQVLLIEDTHWLDSASWKLLEQLVAQVRGTLIILSARPLSGPKHESCERLMSQPEVLHLRLDTLRRDDVRALSVRTLGIVDLDPVLVDLVYDQSGGNPFFVEELLLSLRDTGRIAVMDNCCRLMDAASEPASTLPRTIQGAIESRIDQLTDRQQLALKVASVVGRAFDASQLHDVFPVPVDTASLAAELAAMQRLDLLVSDAAHQAFQFKHSLTQSVAYELLLFSQRKALHRTMAQWYEQHVSDDPGHYQILVHHWSVADDTPKTLKYLALAAAQVLNNDANEEALTYLQRSVALDASSPAPGSATWIERYCNLAEANFRLGRLDACEQHARTALALLGTPLPRSRYQVTGQLTTLLAHQLGTRLSLLRPAARQPVSEPDTGVDALSKEDANALIYHLTVRTGRVAFFKADPTLAVLATLQTLRAAEQMGPSAELANAYAYICVATTFIGLHKLAQRYEQLALDALAASGQQDSLRAAHTLEALGAACCATGRWDTADQHLHRAIELLRAYGDWTEWGSACQVLARTLADRGDFEALMRITAPVLEQARSRSAMLEQSWILGNRLETALYTSNDLTTAQVLIEENTTIHEPGTQLDSGWVAESLVATAWFRLGDIDKAIHHARSALSFFSAHRPVSFGTMVGYWSTAWTILSCLRQTRDQGDVAGRAALAESARIAVKAMSSYAAVFPIGKPRALLCQGLHAHLSGRTAKSRKLFLEARDRARTLSMPYEEAMADMELASHAEIAASDRAAYLASACRGFERLRVAYDLQRAKALQQAQTVTRP